MYVIYSPSGSCFRGATAGSNIGRWFWQEILSKIGHPFESKFAAERQCMEGQVAVSLDEARMIEQLRDL